MSGTGSWGARISRARRPRSSTRDPKFIVQNALGTRTTDLAVRLLFGARSRLYTPHGIVLFTRWLVALRVAVPRRVRATLPAQASRKWSSVLMGTVLARTAWPHSKAPVPKLQYRIPRTSGHVYIIKTYHGKRVTDICALRAAGSQWRIDQELATLGYTTPNVSAVERLHATARQMNPHQVYRSLAFAWLPHVCHTDSDSFVISGHQWKPVKALTRSHCPSSQRHCAARVS